MLCFKDKIVFSRIEGFIVRNEKLRNVAIIAHVDHGKTAPQD